MTFQRLAFTKENESLLRDFVLKEWQIYYAHRRYTTLDRLAHAKLSKSKRKELQTSRYIKRPAPTDLSGACKIVAQLALKVFDLDGTVVSNSRHTFVELSSGMIYDFNRDCADANTMLVRDRKPYELDRKFTRSVEGQRGLNSWDDFIRHIFRGFIKQLPKTVQRHEGRSISKVPTWCRTNKQQPLRRFKVWGLKTTELT